MFLILSVSALGLAQDKVEVSMCVWGMTWEDTIYVDMSIPKFEAQNPNIKVKFDRYEDYWSKVVVLFAGGEAPDVIRESASDSLGLHIRKNMLMPLDDFIKGPLGVDMNDFTRELFTALNWADHTYFFPQDVNNPNALSYNKDLFDKVGLSYPDTSWTLQDLDNATKKLKERYNVFWEIPWFVFTALTYQMGGSAWDPENPERCLLNSPEAIKAAKLLQKWVFDERVAPPVSSGEARSTSLQMFMAGRLPLFLMGCWEIPAIIRDAPNLNFGTTIFPRGAPDRKPGCSLVSSGFSMNRNTKYPEEAWKLLRYLTSTEGLVDYWDITYVAIPARYSVIEAPGFRRPQGLKGKVLPIISEEEFNTKLQWQVDALRNKWLHFGLCKPWQAYLIPRLGPALDELIVKKRGNPEEVLNQLVKTVHMDIEEEKRK